MHFLKRYLGLLIPSLLVGAILWEPIALKRLYVCTDYIPVLSFIPPFVHGKGDPPGDHYLVPPAVVYGTYSAMLVAIVSIPAIIARLMVHQKRSRIELS
jgi:hypothetical protein